MKCFIVRNSCLLLLRNILEETVMLCPAVPDYHNMHGPILDYFWLFLCVKIITGSVVILRDNIIY